MKGGNIMEQSVKPTSTTRGMLGHDDVLSDGQQDTLVYKSESEQIKQPMPTQDPIQNLWADPSLAPVIGIVENEKPEVDEKEEHLGSH